MPDTQEDMVARVRDAIIGALVTGQDPGRAAIAAMKVPTKEMFESAPDHAPAEDGYGLLRAQWQAMIDAALTKR